jgi:hypothetical protein
MTDPIPSAELERQRADCPDCKGSIAGLCTWHAGMEAGLRLCAIAAARSEPSREDEACIGDPSHQYHSHDDDPIAPSRDPRAEVEALLSRYWHGTAWVKRAAVLAILARPAASEPGREAAETLRAILETGIKELGGRHRTDLARALDDLVHLATLPPKEAGTGLDVGELARAILRCIEAAPSRRAWEELSIRQQAEAIIVALSESTQPKPSAES